MDKKVLEQIGKDDQWLISKIVSKYGQVELNDILLATVDESGNVQVMFYY